MVNCLKEISFKPKKSLVQVRGFKNLLSDFICGLPTVPLATTATAA